jgi:hypothetical protein
MSASQAVRTIYTGFPPPLEQVRRQVRSTTGATYCAQTGTLGPQTPIAFTKVIFNRPVLVGSARSSETPTVMGQELRRRAILQVLVSLDEEQLPLPALSEIAAAVGDDTTSQHVGMDLQVLEQRGLLTLWRSSPNHTPRQYIVRLKGSDHHMRSADAPHDVKLAA